MNKPDRLNSRTASAADRPAASLQGRGRARRSNLGDKVLTTRVGLQIPPDLRFEDWESAGRQLSCVVDSSRWWLGDWLTFGKDHYADRYQRGVEVAGLKYQTLRNYAWVSRRFGLSRRRPTLSFQHHAEVAALPADEQDHLLDLAEREKWSTKQLRGAIKASCLDDSPEQSTGSRRLTVPGNRLLFWRKAAEQSGAEFADWVLLALDHAAHRALDDWSEQTDPRLILSGPACPADGTPAGAW
jgi:hypothetical protein